MSSEFIPVCDVYLAGNELEYVTRAVSTGWISSSGTFVTEFERKFAEFCGAKYAVSVCNGTVAIHLGLVCLGIGKGDEVIIPDFTMTASAFSVCYTGARPVFVDAEPDTWNIAPDRIEEKITPATKAIMPVSIFSHPCEMDVIWSLADKYGLKVIEDAAESHGAEYKGRKVGTLADVTLFSFYANKNLTTGEGGMLVTDDREIYDRARYYRNMCFSLDGPRDYIHNDIGFNYRMSNLIAAVGLAQVEKADLYIGNRVRNGRLYKELLKDVPGIATQATRDYVLHVHWMNGISVDPDIYGRTRAELMEHLRKNGVETRLFFVGMHRQPSLIKYGCDPSGEYPVSDRLAANGFYLPSGSNLTPEQITRICCLIADFRR